MAPHDDRPLVTYRPVADGEGLELDGRALRAYKNGDLIATAELPRATGLDALLGSYLAPELMPGLEFCHAEPRREEIELELTSTLWPVVGGRLRLGGELLAWQAERVSGEEFAVERVRRLRPWAAAEKPGHGWEIELPGVEISETDPVFRRRVAIAVEIFLYEFHSRGEDLPLPYRRVVTNVFSSSDPIWPENVPRLVGGPGSGPRM